MFRELLYLAGSHTDYIVDTSGVYYIICLCPGFLDVHCT